MGLFGHPPTPVDRRQPRLPAVHRTEDIGGGMRRIVLRGDLDGFPVNADAAHIKLFFPRPGQSQPVLPTLGPNGPIWPPDDVRPIVRTYTVRRFLPDVPELWVDFVLHGHGAGGLWAEHAKPGDVVGLAGPGGPQPFAPAADYYLLVGDPSAAPALCAVLENLPPTARGQVFLELATGERDLPLPVHPGFGLQVLRRLEASAAGSTLLLDAVREMDWPSGSVTPIIAGESTAVVAMRDYLRTERGFTAKFYALPFWKAGEDEESYHAERHQIMDQ